MRSFMCCSRFATWAPRCNQQQGWPVALVPRGECGLQRWPSTGCNLNGVCRQRTSARSLPSQPHQRT
eukprot:6520134-Prorocentrum_lima.AAC.1